MEKLQVKLYRNFKQVKAEVLERKNVTNISQALAGEIAGFV
jgi:hypothetical protein